jgi:uncharacterized membrane protein (DUF485 family)
MKKEPIHYPWIWVCLVLIVVFSVPWYLPKTAVNPIILGFPLWAFIALIMSVVLSGFLSYVVNRYWDDSEEEGE